MRYLLPYFFLVAPFISQAQQPFCNAIPTEPLSLSLPAAQAEGNREVVLSHDAVLAVPQAPGTVQLHHTQSNQLIDQIINWPEAPVEIAELVAAPLAYDRNYDGLTDAIYLTDEQGLVWYVAITATGFDTPVLIADLRSAGVVYRQPMLLVQTIQRPAFEHFVSDAQPAVKLILIGTNSAQQDSLIAFSHRPERANVVRLDDMVDRTHRSQDEINGNLSDAVWQQWHDAPGWTMQLSGRIIVQPEVYAGVVYVVSNPQPAVGQPCQIAEDAQADLHAVHLHHAAAVYSARRLSVPALNNASLRLQSDGNDMSLVLENAEQSQQLLSQMLSINSDCINCTEPLKDDDYPRLRRLATFLTEEGAF